MSASKKKYNKYATAGLLLGAVALPFSILPLAGYAFVALGIAALVLSIIGTRHEGQQRDAWLGVGFSGTAIILGLIISTLALL
jgi:hypothetical protein